MDGVVRTLGIHRLARDAEAKTWLRVRLCVCSAFVSSNPKYHLEAVQMSKQGVGRFCGSCRLMSALGIAQKVGKGRQVGKRRACGNADDEADAESLGADVETEGLQLGNTFKYKLLEHDSGQLKKFVTAALR